MRFPKRILSATVLMIGGLVLVGGVNTAWGQCEADEFAKIFASDGTDGDYFGKAVSISGDCAVIGAEYDDIGASATGSAYVYCLEDSSWVQKGKLTASDAGWANWFGSSVSISGDVIVVGAFGDDDMGNDSGSAYVFVKPADGWASMTETAKLWSSNGSTVDRFGRSVSISGNVIVAGAAWDTWESGTAYVFVKPSGGWVDSFEDAMLWASDSDLNDFFGYSVAISGDTIVVGAMYNDDNGNKSGSAYIFEEPVGGWVNMTETAKLMPHDGAAEDEFGFSVAISGDTAVIGAPNDRNTHGSAYVFEKPAGGWADWLEWMPETAKLRAWGSTSEDYFGKSVSISGDIIVVGAYGDDDNGDNAGAAYAYKKPSGGWVDTAETFKMLASDGEQYDRMGRAVGISDGIAVIGSYKDRDDCGSAYLFHGIEDCNGNDVLDICDIAMGTSEDCLPNGTPDECELDCNSNAIPDECDIIAGTSEDCNANGIPDECDFASGNVEDCNANGIIDECELDGNDCNNNGVPDECDVTGGHNCCETGHGPQCSNQAIRDCVCANDPYCCEVDWDRICVMEVTSEGCFNCEVNNDCNANTIPDECDLAAGTSEDCNFNEVPDECDIADGVSNDCNGNNVPDECELQGNDCNNNNIPDECDITGGTSNDCNNNDVPDECDLDGNDCNNNDIPDECDIAGGTSNDCNNNDVPDECDLAGNDCNKNDIPDECDIAGGTSNDCNNNGVPDECDLDGNDCNKNDIPDECDIAGGTSNDCNNNGVPDECELQDNDCNANDVPDECDLPGGHNCCEWGNGVGCSNPAIQDCVCDIDPYCCEVEWDRACVLEATIEGCWNCRDGNDCNTNAVPDECDIADGTSQDCNSNGVPDECETFDILDLNADGDVDLDDCVAFADCLTGPRGLIMRGEVLYHDSCCAAADVDFDGDVDMKDFAALQVTVAQP